MSAFNFILPVIFLLITFSQSPQTRAPKKPQPVEVGEDEVLRVDTNLVGVPVVVMDREGRFVPDLKREDFHIYEDGVEQQIAYFAPVESNVTVLLLFDDFIAKNFTRDYRQTATAFAERLGVGDKVLVAKFGDSKYEILTKVADGPAGVQKEERPVKWRFGKGVHDAVDAAIRRMNALAGRKAILLLSDGLDRPDTITITQTMPGGRLVSMDVTKPNERTTAVHTINEAEESNAPFYVMQYDTMPDIVRQGPDPKHPDSMNAMTVMYRNEYQLADDYLHALAEKSGGRLYQVPSGSRDKKKESPPQIAQAFAEISSELRQQYSLGYYPKDADKGKEPREIKVRVTRPDVVVRSRTSYVAVPPRR